MKFTIEMSHDMSKNLYQMTKIVQTLKIPKC